MIVVGKRGEEERGKAKSTIINDGGSELPEDV
jgi:hypothetical protein